MRLLLDENLPKRLKEDFPGHEIFTVRDKSWNGLLNGELLQHTSEEAFDALITFDKNLQHQHNLNNYRITIFVLSASNNTYLELTNLSSMVLDYLSQETLAPGVIIINK